MRFCHQGGSILGFFLFLIGLDNSDAYIIRCAGGSGEGCSAYRNSSTKYTDNRTSRIDMVIRKGQNIDLPCYLPNPHGLEKFWRHQSTTGKKFSISSFSIVQNLPSRLHISKDFTLQIFSVGREDSGFYACTVLGKPPVTNLFHLNVLESPSLTTEPASGSITVEEGDAVELGCSAKGNPTPSVTWQKEYGTDPNVTLPRAEALHFNRANPRHTGIYICNAHNGIEPPAQKRIELRVLYPPDLVIPNRIIHGGTRYPATLKCVVHGDPPPQIEWFIEQKNISTTKRIYSKTEGPEHTLHFTNIRDTDFGLYTCSAKNTIGYAVGYVELSGVPKPPVVVRWETSPCDKNNARKLRRKKKKAGRRTCKCRKRRTRNVGCTVHVTLEWVVESYSSLIDYRIMLRHSKAPPPNSPSNPAGYSVDNEDKVMVWTELFIPADPTAGPIHTKYYTLHGLKRGLTYEGALTARNKYGVSQLSTIFYITPTPRTSHTLADINALFVGVPRLTGELDETGDEDESKGENVIYSVASSSLRECPVFINPIQYIQLTVPFKLRLILQIIIILIIYN